MRILFPTKMLLSISTFTVLIISLSSCVAEDEIRKMKIRELKTFLEDRDEDYSRCVEKRDFINAAVAVKDKKISAAKQKLKGYLGAYPECPFWEFWASEARQMAVESGITEKGQQALYATVETCFMQHGKSVATKLKKGAGDLLKTSLKSPYYQAGVLNMKILTEHYVSHEAQRTDIRQKSESIFLPWITNVGIENTNPMYEILESKKQEL